MNAIEDRVVPDKRSWDRALKFMENTVNKKIEQNRQFIDEQKGPGFWSRWLLWRQSTDDHRAVSILENEFREILTAKPVRFLDYDR